jgi:hypothetical protein
MTDNVTAYLEKMLKRDFESGNKSALLDALYVCLELKRPIPKWLQVAFLNAFEAVERYEIRTWEQAFGKPVPKGTHLKPRKRDAELSLNIIERVEALKRAGTKVDKDLFRAVGREWGINGTRASEIYYAARRRKPRK